MKLKYKKIILLTTMSTMGIGLLTLSVSQDNPKANDGLNNVAAVETSMFKEDAGQDAALMSAESTEAPEEFAAISPEPTTTPAPTAIPVYDIEELGTYPEIDNLFNEFYKAKNNCDVNKLKELLSDPTEVETQEELNKKTEYIEDYKNIKAYTKKALEEGTYIVYVYSEIKFTGVNTPAPQLMKFYVITGEDSKLKIYSGELEKELGVYFDERDSDKDVGELIDMTNKAGQEAREKDEDLLNFWNKLDELAKNQSTEKAEGDAAE